MSRRIIGFNSIVIILFAVFTGISLIFEFSYGLGIFRQFTSFSADMFKIIPCVFVLIGLFEVWVKKETIERNFGPESGALGYLWAILLAGTVVGGLYVAFPVAYSLYKKGARWSKVLTYLGAAANCRIPLTVFEASFVGIKFTIIRMSVALPLIIFSSVLLGRYFEKKRYNPEMCSSKI